jgi:beta-lactamase class D
MLVTMCRGTLLLAALFALTTARAPSAQAAAASVESCFLLYEIGVGEAARSPAQGCATRVTPASTFKVPHAMAALESGVVGGPDEIRHWDGQGQWPDAARRDHSLATAMRYSVVWYFQHIAERLGADRERHHLRTLAFGNMDPSSGLTTFWIGGSLLITPEEQLAFWRRLYEDALPVSAKSVGQVRQMLVQPADVVVNAAGRHTFAAPWPPGTVVSAKTGSATDRSGRGVRWLNGHVTRGGRSFVFVTCVTGPPSLAANAAIDLAAKRLRDLKVL